MWRIAPIFVLTLVISSYGFISENLISSQSIKNVVDHPAENGRWLHQLKQSTFYTDTNHGRLTDIRKPLSPEPVSTGDEFDFFVYLPIILSSSSNPLTETITVNPKNIDDVLYNPGIGMEVPRSGQVGDSPYPHARISYFRYYWSDLEPVKGEIDFVRLEQDINNSAQEGQRVAIRIMAVKGDTTAVPAWLVNEVGGEYFGQTFWPDYNDPTFVAEVERFMMRLGERLGDNPNINHIDIGFLGCWGEANKACVEGEDAEEEEENDDGPEIWTVTTRRKIIDVHYKAFPNVPKIELGQFGWQDNELGGYDSYAHDKGAGWRVDCFGDPDHHQTFYEDMVANHPDAWQEGPVALETCHTMADWQTLYGFTDEVFKSVMNTALEWHASSINNKGIGVPTEWMPILLETLKRLGYRLTLDELEHTTNINAGGELEIRMRWQNLGVAPPYHPYSVVMEFVPQNGGPAWQHEFTSIDVRDWLPGTYTVSETIVVPNEAPAGVYQMRVGLLYPHNQQPAIQLANEGKDVEGWYPLSQISIVP